MHPLLNMSPPSEQNETQRSDKSDGAPFLRADGLFVSRIRALRPRVSIREERRGEGTSQLPLTRSRHILPLRVASMEVVTLLPLIGLNMPRVQNALIKEGSTRSTFYTK